MRTTGPLLFLNDGHGKFQLKPDAFHFANEPQGTFTGAAIADYDRDGWLDIYFCLYIYYQGTDQYRYPIALLRREQRSAQFHVPQQSRRQLSRRNERNQARSQQHAIQFLLRLG